MCHYQQLEGFTKLENPLTAKQIKAILGRPFPFLRTMTGISDGEKILAAISQ